MGRVLTILVLCFAASASAQETMSVCRQLTADTGCATSTTASNGLGPLPALLKQLSDQRCGVARLRDWYESHAQAPQVLFRVVGVLTILLSVAVPYLGTLEGRWRSTVLPIVALSIAALTGINSFFQWQVQWTGFRTTELNLRFALAQWNVRIAEACNQADPEMTTRMAIAATDSLLDHAREVVSSETGRYFDSTRFEKSGEAK